MMGDGTETAANRRQEGANEERQATGRPNFTEEQGP